MTLWEKIIAIYPQLTDADFGRFGSIKLRDDGDGLGEYIEKWEHELALPEGFKVGK